MRELSIDDFEAHVGESYGLDGSDISLILESASALPGSSRPGGGFRLAFRGPREPLLPQGIYAMRRGDQAFDLFIVPIALTDAGAEYEAVFY
jgi:hypothetical protein